MKFLVVFLLLGLSAILVQSLDEAICTPDSDVQAIARLLTKETNKKLKGSDIPQLQVSDLFVQTFGYFAKNLLNSTAANLSTALLNQFSDYLQTYQSFDQEQKQLFIANIIGEINTLVVAIESVSGFAPNGTGSSGTTLNGDGTISNDKSLEPIAQLIAKEANKILQKENGEADVCEADVLVQLFASNLVNNFKVKSANPKNPDIKAYVQETVNFHRLALLQARGIEALILEFTVNEFANIPAPEISKKSKKSKSNKKSDLKSKSKSKSSKKSEKKGNKSKSKKQKNDDDEDDDGEDNDYDDDYKDNKKDEINEGDILREYIDRIIRKKLRKYDSY